MHYDIFYKKKENTGFTLIELMITVAVLSILAVIALPKFANIVRSAQEGRNKGNLAIFRTAINVYYGDNDGYWPYSNKLIIGGTGQLCPSDWSFLAPQYIDEIPNIYTGQINAWGNSHEGKNRICVAWTKGGSVGVVQDAAAGVAHHENAYEYLYYICNNPTDGTEGYNNHIWINCELVDKKGKKIILW